MKNNKAQVMLRLFICMIICCFMPRVSAQKEEALHPRIINGTPNFDNPASGALLALLNQTEAFQLICSGSLITPDAFLTAAHCLCPGLGLNCQPGGAQEPDLSSMRVFLPNAGLININAVSIDPDYHFPFNDLAVLQLAQPVFGVAALALTQRQPDLGGMSTLIGFGRTTNNSATAGIKRIGDISLSSCGLIGLPDNSFLCWVWSPLSQLSNACPGDSGGSVLISNTLELSGIIAGGLNACDTTDIGFATAIAPHRDWIESMSNSPITTVVLNDQLITVANRTGILDTQTTASLIVPPGISRMVVSANMVDLSSEQTELSVNALPPTANDACFSNHAGVFQSCEVDKPAAGHWDITYTQITGISEEFQLTASLFEPHCLLDIDGNGKIDALTDGLLVIRQLFGLSNLALIDSAIGISAWRKTSDDILSYLSAPACQLALDIDGDGSLNALTDGLLIIRYLFGLNGDALVSDALAGRATRKTAIDIQAWLKSKIVVATPIKVNL